ncbi:MAG: DUF2357 domain-containing protein [Alicyclobacillus sp.]|nr:DUF2357 domain-containing protein [Alicyclobacillus sp.]
MDTRSDPSAAMRVSALSTGGPPSRPLPFRVHFLLGPEGHPNRLIPVARFAPPEVPLEQLDIGARLRENTPLEVVFQAEDPDARLYMDGLEMLAEREVEIDPAGRPYLEPSSQPRVLYAPSNEYYPYIPGYYRLEVETGGQRYRTLVQIEPSRITRAQWEVMRDELNAQLTGLAETLVRRHIGVGDDVTRAFPAALLHRFLVVEKHFAGVRASLMDLRQRPNHRIRTEYQLTPAGRAKAMDGVTMRDRLTHPERVESLMVPIRQVDHDLPENRWVVKIVEYVRRCLEDVLSAIAVQQAYVEGELEQALYYAEDPETSAQVREKRMLLAELGRHAERARQMQHGLSLVSKEPWFQDLRRAGEPSAAVPHVLRYDARYRALYQLYRELKSGDVSIVIDPAFSYQWKRTDLLYELWGFLGVCTALEAVGFAPQRGWVYDAVSSSGVASAVPWGGRDAGGTRMFLPMLAPETLVAMELGDVRLHVVYDGTLPSRASQTNLDRVPLHMLGGYHTRPDTRIDVFDRSVYVGSIVIDFKYTSPTAIWNPSARPNRRTRSTHQLMAYATDSQSVWLYGADISHQVREQMRPVIEVWGVYPQNESYRQLPQAQYDDAHHVRLVPLSPGMDNHHFSAELEAAVRRVLEVASEARKR